VDLLAERVSGPVWGSRIAMSAVSVLTAVTVFTGHGWERVFAAVGLTSLIALAALSSWERAHPRPKRRRSREKPSTGE
jgi:hypothetical protein